MWFKVSGAGVWTDNQFRVLVELYVDGSNAVVFRKNNTNALAWIYKASGTVSQQVSAYTPTTFTHMASTWSASADEARHYYNGVQEGTTKTGLGVWVGTFDPTAACIGSQNVTPTLIWDGYLAHCALWANVLTPAQVLSLATV